MLGLRTSGDAYEELLFKGEKLSNLRRRLEEMRAAGIDKDPRLILSLRDNGADWFNFGNGDLW